MNMITNLTTTLITILTVTFIGLFIWYADLVKRKHRVDKALADIDAQLSLRHEIIPNVLAITRRYLGHERVLMEKMTALHNAARKPLNCSDTKALHEKFHMENQLSANFRHLFAACETYPELKGDAVITRVQAACQEAEIHVATARRHYNSAVNGLRNACLIVPGPWLAPLAGVRQIPPFFETPSAYENSAGIMNDP
jgi:LemA protein